MSVKFNVVERGNPGDPSAPQKYYPSAVASGKVNMRAIAKRAAEISTLSMPDTVAAITAALLLGSIAFFGTLIWAESSIQACLSESS